ncbi:hypothetical protein K438DRAFT_1970133 [Mycena galopus ATCC 62051]|nr:hypothetical protein K438DRAFT_1970133 [Mycena galopus ATCC 62051]
MDASFFTFTCELPTDTNTIPWLLPPAAGCPLFTSFHLNSTAPAGTRAAAQARYRERHQDSECAKAHQRMQALRQAKKQDVAKHHFGTLSESERDPEYMVGWNRFRFTRGDFDRQNTLFVLKYSTPAVLAPTSDEVDRCLGELNNYTLTFDLDWENAEDVEAYDRLTLNAFLDDNDVEFMFRHAVPSPTIENTEI